MGATGPGADELRIRGILRRHGVGPAAVPPPVPPKPTVRPRDWLDDILNSPPPTPASKPEQDTAPPPAKPKPKKPRKTTSTKRRKPKPGAARTAWDSRPASPRQSLLDAWDAVPYRLKWLAYHASAAYLGWSCGLVGYVTYVTAWIADTGLIGLQATFWYGAAAATFLLHRRTRSWWWPIAWLAAVPATSTVVGVLLYAPTQ
jgi:hypothetical protein